MPYSYCGTFETDIFCMVAKFCVFFDSFVPSLLTSPSDIAIIIAQLVIQKKLTEGIRK